MLESTLESVLKYLTDHDKNTHGQIVVKKEFYDFTMSYEIFVLSIKLLENGGYISVKEDANNLNKLPMFHIEVTEKGHSYFCNKEQNISQQKRTRKIEDAHLTIDKISLVLSVASIIISVIALA
jgi:hypothetical protein